MPLSPQCTVFNLNILFFQRTGDSNAKLNKEEIQGAINDANQLASQKQQSKNIVFLLKQRSALLDVFCLS